MKFSIGSSPGSLLPVHVSRPTAQTKAGDFSAGVSLTKSPLPFFFGFAQPPWNV